MPIVSFLFNFVQCYKVSQNSFQAMSNSNRHENRSPGNPKLARYLHRIQQLVGNRGRSSSPLSSRTSRPIKPNSLDHYLKYELTFKILCGVFDKKNNYCMRHFFSALRTHEGHKVEKIYKFVPIQKTQCAHMVVDTSISTKMLTNVLKTRLKDNIKAGFDALKGLMLSESYILNTARSNQASIVPLSTSPKRNLRIGVALQRLILTRSAYTFFMIKRQYLNGEQQQQIRKTNQTQVFKIKFLVKIVSAKRLMILGNCMNNLIINNLHKSNEEIQDQKKYEKNSQKLKKIASVLYFKAKYQYLNGVKLLASFRKCSLKFQEEAEENRQKASQMVSTQTHRRLNNELIYESVNKINIALISISTRRKFQLITNLNNIKKRKQKACHLILQTTKHKLKLNCSSTFQTLKQMYVQHNELDNSEYGFGYGSGSGSGSGYKMKLKQKWIALGYLLNINYYFRQNLRQPFRIIRQFSQNRAILIESIQIFLFYSAKSRVRECFCLLVDQAEKKKAVDQSREEKSRIFPNVNQMLLPRVLNKLLIVRCADCFIKIKSCKKKPLTNSTVQKKLSPISCGWVSDIESFIQQRQRFNKSLIQNYKKIEQIINTSNHVTNNTNRSFEQQVDHPSPGQVFSPKNKTIKSSTFRN